ncbi:hypothetical protein LP414_08300 [Polaromonas sp. P1(28)-13]|nr:hypothetical protein LP414_08300 [Polaromonas sp. P1(28)-13]
MFAFEGLGQVRAMSNPEFHEGKAAAIGSRRPDCTGGRLLEQHERERRCRGVWSVKNKIMLTFSPAALNYDVI